MRVACSAKRETDDNTATQLLHPSQSEETLQRAKKRKDESSA